MQGNDPAGQDPAAILAWSIVDSALLALASSTAAYEVVLFARFPAWALYPLSVGIFLILIFSHLNIGHMGLRKAISDKTAISLIALGVLCFFFNIFSFRPDADDFSFLHRALYCLSDLHAPLPVQHTAHDVKNLPAISPVHLTTSIETISSLLANLLHLKPVSFIHNIFGGICLFIFPFVMYLFYRFMSFSGKYAYLGVVLTIILYIFSGDSHQDWGNFTIVRAWQGKTVFILLFVPLTALLTFKFVFHGENNDLFRLHLAAISSIGLTGTSFFLFPFIVGFSVLGTVGVQWKEQDYFRRTMTLGSLLMPFLVMTALIQYSGILPKISNTDVWSMVFYGIDDKGWPELVMLARTVFQKTTTIWFYVIACVGTLLLSRQNGKIKSLVISTLLVCIALVLPPVSSILIKITLPGAYWRLAYATQMPVIIATFVLICLCGSPQITGWARCRKEEWARKGIAQEIEPTRGKSLPIFGVLLFFCFLLLKTSSLRTEVLAMPHEFKLPNPEREVAMLVEEWVPSHTLALIPEILVPAIGLLRPDIRMLSTRSLETLHVFINAGRKGEGEARVDGQRDLDSCGKQGKARSLIAANSGLGLLIFSGNCQKEAIVGNTSIEEKDWAVKRTRHYQIWLKK
jgi:hypothetical protein